VRTAVVVAVDGVWRAIAPREWIVVVVVRVPVGMMAVRDLRRVLSTVKRDDFGVAADAVEDTRHRFCSHSLTR